MFFFGVLRRRKPAARHAFPTGRVGASRESTSILPCRVDCVLVVRCWFLFLLS